MEAAFPTVDLKATGANIVRLRKQQGLSVKEIQVYFGFEQPQAIYKWQRGECLPSVDNLFALSRLLHTPIDTILIGNDRDFFILWNFFISENGVEIKLRFPSAEEDSEETITYGVLAVIFLATVFSVFQIFLMQMKRRVKRITLFKAIGATNGQVAKMLASECMYVLLRGIPVGLLAGTVLSYALIQIMNRVKGTKLLFQMDVPLLAKGILLGILAVVLGMIIPMVKAMHQKAVNSALIIGISGVAAAAIALIILYNLSLSKMEAESERIGILQSLGVTGGQFKWLYLKNGIGCGIFSLVIAHLVFFAVLYITSCTSVANLSFYGRIRDIWMNQLYHYPVGLHVGVCVVFFIICVSTYYQSVRNVINRQPVDNIRSLSR